LKGQHVLHKCCTLLSWGEATISRYGNATCGLVWYHPLWQVYSSLFKTHLCSIEKNKQTSSPSTRLLISFRGSRMVTCRHSFATNIRSQPNRTLLVATRQAFQLAIGVVRASHGTHGIHFSREVDCGIGQSYGSIGGIVTVTFDTPIYLVCGLRMQYHKLQVTVTPLVDNIPLLQLQDTHHHYFRALRCYV
jgi:hypothetical protein